MARGRFEGFERPPWWAVVLMLIALAVIAVIGPLVLTRGRVPASVIAAANASESAAAAAASSSAAVAHGPTLTQLRADGDLTIYYLGDSITDGWNATTQDRGFRPDLTRTLAAGGKTTEASTYKAGATAAEVAALNQPPAHTDVTVIELGTNDVARTDPGQFSKDYGTLVARMHAVSSRMVCVGVFRVGGQAQQLDGIIRSSCERARGVFVSIEDMWQDPRYTAPKGAATYPQPADGGHPGDAGHTEIARRIMAALQS